MASSSFRVCSAIVGGFLVFVGACSNGTEPRDPICGGSAPVSLSEGEVTTPITSSSVCVSGGGSGAEFALIPFNGSTVYSNVASMTFTATGASAVPSPALSRTDGDASLFNTGPGLAGSVSLAQPLVSFEARLRRSEQRFLTPRMSAARAWYRNRLARDRTTGRLGPSFSISGNVPAIGDLMTLNTKVGDTFAAACTTADLRTGRVVAITNSAIVVADIANPAGGYSDADYLAIGQKFDTVFTVDTTAFSAPTDIDGNGRIIIFFTRAVNEMTPTGSESFVGGFFYGRDLFPRADTPEFGEGCTTSNVAEMFYVIVPDPNGEVNGNVRAKDFVSRIAVSTTAHEFQHLINASRRLYVNTSAADFEIEWLNEGLSHIAEELFFYNQSAGLAPRMNIDSLRFKGNQQNTDAYNADQSSNFGRLRLYLAKPSSNSPYAPNDSLETRGATWSFLRYAADHRGTSDGDTWRLLVNSPTRGLANLRNVFGTDLTTLFRDWATTTLTDDVTGVGNQWQHPSWNFRSIYHYIPSIRRYPLTTLTIGEGTPLTAALNGGGAAYIRFTVAAGQTASIKWTTEAADVQVSVVRLK